MGEKEVLFRRRSDARRELDFGSESAGVPTLEEDIVDAKTVSNLPLEMPTNYSVGSFTTSNFQPPQGEVMKLEVPKLADTRADESCSPPFGTHVREAISVVKDWMKNP